MLILFTSTWIFSSLPALHNGANRNPSYATYQKTNNSIILGQSSISRKSNTSGKAAEPYSFNNPGPIRQKSHIQSCSPSESMLSVRKSTKKKNESHVEAKCKLMRI